MKVDDMEPISEKMAEPLAMDRQLLLSEHVRLAVKDYLTRLNGDEVSNLYNMVLNEVERPLIQVVMEQCGHNQSKAAQMLGLSRSTLRKKLVCPSHS